MARKAKKKRHQMPKLSLVDQLIYWVIMAFLVAVYFGSLLVLIIARNSIAFSDPDVVAAGEHFSVLWFLPGWMCFFLMTFIIWNTYYQGRRPIFGIRGFRYGPPAWPRVYPVFMKEKPYVWVSDKAVHQKKQFAVFLLVLLLVCCLPMPLAFCGRDSLLPDGSVVEYNAMNRIAEHYTPVRVEEVEFGTCRVGGSRYRSGDWSVDMTLTMTDGQRYRFTSGDFRGGSENGVRIWLARMCALKKVYFPEKICYDGTEKLERVILEQNLNEREAALLYELFSIS